MWRVRLVALTCLLALPGPAAWADDVTGSSRLLCAAVEATVSFEDGECAVGPPWNLNIPQFIEVDLEGNQLATTRASGENRSTPIEHLSRRDGTIVFHGFEMGRAFSWVITEQTGQVTVVVAAQHGAVTIFGACTPMPTAAEPANE